MKGYLTFGNEWIVRNLGHLPSRNEWIVRNLGHIQSGNESIVRKMARGKINFVLEWHKLIQNLSKNMHVSHFWTYRSKTEREWLHFLTYRGCFWSSGGIARLGMNGLCGILAISHLGGTVDDDDYDDTPGYPHPPPHHAQEKKHVVSPGSSLR